MRPTAAPTSVLSSASGWLGDPGSALLLARVGSEPPTFTGGSPLPQSRCPGATSGAAGPGEELAVPKVSPKAEDVSLASYPADIAPSRVRIPQPYRSVAAAALC